MRLNEFADQVRTALGTRLVTLLLYGSAARAPEAAGGEPHGMNTLLIVDRADPDLFAALAAPVRGWIKRHPPPLILTEGEWRTSADAFPIEYEDIRASHRVVAGRIPWHGIRIQREHLRRQLEHELMGKLVHLRQSYAAAWNDSRRLRDVIDATRAGFLTMLRAVLRLDGRAPSAAPDALVREAGGLIGFAPAPEHLTEPVGYLDAVTRTAEYVNRMERNPS
jgi:hypothetical protein